MRRQLMWSAAITVVLGTLAGYASSVMATPAAGFTGTTIAKATFADIDVANHVLRESGDATPVKDLWLSIQRTKGPSDLYVQNNVWLAGGSTGWHTHPGHSLIIVTAGAVTAYEGTDTSCTPPVYTAGMGFVDPGGDHVHLLRNEGTSEARTVAVQLLPSGATRRIDAEAPSGCTVR